MFKRIRGFTLIEIMIGILVFGILLAIGVPSFENMIRNNRMTSNVNTFVTSLNQARSEAVKQNLPVILCSSANGTSCGGNSVNWEEGWVVYVDRNNDGDIDGGNDCGSGAANDCILTVEPGLAGELSLRSSANSLRYVGSGASDSGPTFTMCDSRGTSDATAVIVAASGRPSISQTEPDGSALSCP